MSTNHPAPQPEPVHPGQITEVVYADRKGRIGWAMFDFANQPFFTVITTFIFAPYLTSKVIGNAVAGQVLWGYTQAAMGIAIALLSPVLGAVADQTGNRKKWVVWFSLMCIIGCLVLWFSIPNPELMSYPKIFRDQIVEESLIGTEWSLFVQPAIFVTLVAMFLATVGVECAGMFNNAMLPNIVPVDRMGRLSGIAWGVGYIGGLIPLIIVLFVFTDQLGGPRIPLDLNAGEDARLTGPMSGLWFVVFIIPMILWTPDVKDTGKKLSQAVKDGIESLTNTISQVRHYKNIARFIISRMIYTDGVNALIAFGGTYAVAQFGWGTFELGIYGLILNIVAIPGTIACGWLDDLIGSKRTINIAVGCLAVATIGIVSLSNEKYLFVLDFPVPKNSFNEIKVDEFNAATTKITEVAGTLTVETEKAALIDAANKIQVFLTAEEATRDVAHLEATNALKVAFRTAYEVENQMPADQRHGVNALADASSLLKSAIKKKGFLSAPQELLFLGFSFLIGFGLGPAQSASRTMMGRLAPPEMAGEFFGLYSLTGKATAWMAPLTISIVTDIFDSQRVGFASVIVFFVGGLVLLLPVKEEQAKKAV